MATMTAYTVTDSQDLGPGSNLTTKVGDKEVFLLESEEQYKLQNYVDTGIRLPTSDSEMRMLLGYKKEEARVLFVNLVHVYSQIFSHCSHFKTQVYPKSVSLALDVSAYARMAPDYYDAVIQTFEDAAKKDMSKQEALAIIDELVAALRKTVDSYIEKTKEVHTAIQGFATNTTADQGLLDTAKATYSNEFDLNESTIEQEQARIETIKSEVEALKAEYTTAVIIASTTVTYAWIPFFGYFIGPTIAGIYGAKAVEINNKIAALGEELRTKSDDVQLRIVLKASLALVNGDLEELKAMCDAALTTLTRIQLVWTELDAGLNRLPAALDNIDNATFLLTLKLAVNAAKNEWQAIATKADSYTSVAYLKVEEITL